MPHALFHLSLGILFLFGSIPFAEHVDRAIQKAERVKRGLLWVSYCLLLGALYWLTYD